MRNRSLSEDLDHRVIVAELRLVLLLKRYHALLQGADHLQAGAVAYVSQTRVFVTAEVALADLAVGGAVKECTPRLKLPYAIWGFLGMQLGHAVVVEELAATHRVAEVNLPVVVGVHIAHGCSNATLSHDCVGLAEERLAQDGCLLAGLASGDGRAKTRATGTDDDHVELQLRNLGHADEPFDLEEVEVRDLFGGYEVDVEVGESNKDHRDPRVAHVIAVELADPRPHLVASRVLREVLQTPTNCVPARVARQRVEPEEGCIKKQHEGANACVTPLAIVVAEGNDGVVREDGIEDQAREEEPAVRVLEDQREARLAGVLAVRFGDRTRRRRLPEGPVVRLAVVVASEAEAEREDQNQ